MKLNSAKLKRIWEVNTKFLAIMRYIFGFLTFLYMIAKLAVYDSSNSLFSEEIRNIFVIILSYYGNVSIGTLRVFACAFWTYKCRQMSNENKGLKIKLDDSEETLKQSRGECDMLNRQIEILDEEAEYHKNRLELAEKAIESFYSYSVLKSISGWF